MIDAAEAGFDAVNTALIVTSAAGAIRDGVMERLDRGVTLLWAEGGFTGEERIVPFVAINRRQLQEGREIVSEADPNAFILISPSHDVRGEGCKPPTRPPRAPRGRTRHGDAGTGDAGTGCIDREVSLFLL